MNYFGEDDINILAECTDCKRVVKVKKDLCVKMDQGIKLRTSLKCICNKEFDFITGEANNLTLGFGVTTLVAHGNSFDLEFRANKLSIKKKGLIKKEISIPIEDILVTDIKKPGIFQPGKFSIIYLSGKKKNELLTMFGKANFSQFEQVHRELKRYVREIRGVCNVCSNVWHFTSTDLLIEKSKQMKNLGKDLLSLGAFLPLALLPNEKVHDLERCPNCGSRAVTLKDVINKR